MATSSLLGIDSDNLPPVHSATGIDSLGPSDASDSGSDSAGVYSADSDSDTDRFGTGERGSVEQDSPTARDILPDHVESMGVGGPDEGADPDDGTQTDLSDALDADPGRQNANTSPLTADDLPDRPLTDADAQDGDEEELETAQR
ncbi:hypothetical protein LJR129_001765 [Acidovorax sp. LjRoot129]|uniref:hypothetical protein n=1 Tax=Acidovorax sp. LjRoot129 TaxID=3342260 RepID=UPI003ECC4574